MRGYISHYFEKARGRLGVAFVHENKHMLELLSSTKIEKKYNENIIYPSNKSSLWCINYYMQKYISLCGCFPRPYSRTYIQLDGNGDVCSFTCTEDFVAQHSIENIIRDIIYIRIRVIKLSEVTKWDRNIAALKIINSSLLHNKSKATSWLQRQFVKTCNQNVCTVDISISDCGNFTSQHYTEIAAMSQLQSLLIQYQEKIVFLKVESIHTPFLHNCVKLVYDKIVTGQSEQLKIWVKEAITCHGGNFLLPSHNVKLCLYTSSDPCIPPTNVADVNLREYIILENIIGLSCLSGIEGSTCHDYTLEFMRRNCVDFASLRKRIQQVLEGFLQLSNIKKKDFTADHSRVTVDNLHIILQYDFEMFYPFTLASILNGERGDHTYYTCLKRIKTWRLEIPSMKYFLLKQIGQLHYIDHELHKNFLKLTNLILNYTIKKLSFIGINVLHSKTDSLTVILNESNTSRETLLMVISDIVKDIIPNFRGDLTISGPWKSVNIFNENRYYFTPLDNTVMVKNVGFLKKNNSPFERLCISTILEQHLIDPKWISLMIENENDERLAKFIENMWETKCTHLDIFTQYKMFSQPGFDSVNEAALFVRMAYPDANCNIPVLPGQFMRLTESLSGENLSLSQFRQMCDAVNIQTNASIVRENLAKINTTTNVIPLDSWIKSCSVEWGHYKKSCILRISKNIKKLFTKSG
jgi:hypothetical protein